MRGGKVVEGRHKKGVGEVAMKWRKEERKKLEESKGGKRKEGRRGRGEVEVKEKGGRRKNQGE